MSNHIWDNVMQVAGNISPFSAAVILLITLVGAVLMIALCNGGMIVVRSLCHRLFTNKTDGENEHEPD